MITKICVKCKIAQSLLHFDLQSKNKINRDNRCKECVKKIKREKRQKINQEKYFNEIRKNGYFLKTCSIHGGLNYSEIKLRVKQNSDPYKSPLWVELICIKCKKDDDKADYNNLERYLFRLNLSNLKCSSCKKELKIKEYSNSGLKTKYAVCKTCASERTSKSYKEKSLLWRYGLSLKEYDELNEKQKGLCKICNKKNDVYHKLYVDHNHLTGEIRGLLCRACNAAIGMFKDNPYLLRQAAMYLEEK